MEQFLCLLHKAGPGKCSSNILGKLYSHWEWMWIVNTVYPSTLWKTMRMLQTWYAGVKNVACKCTTHNYNQVPNSIFTDQHHIQRCVTMIVIVSQLCHWWLTTPQLLVQQTPTLNTISPKFFGHAINDRKLRHSSWKCNLCTHVQRQACAHNTDVADAKSTVTTSTHRRHFHMPHVLLLSLLLFFYVHHMLNSCVHQAQTSRNTRSQNGLQYKLPTWMAFTKHLCCFVWATTMWKFEVQNHSLFSLPFTSTGNENHKSHSPQKLLLEAVLWFFFFLKIY